MLHDCHGKPLAVGDRVILTGTVHTQLEDGSIGFLTDIPVRGKKDTVLVIKMEAAMVKKLDHGIYEVPPTSPDGWLDSGKATGRLSEEEVNYVEFHGGVLLAKQGAELPADASLQARACHHMQRAIIQAGGE